MAMVPGRSSTSLGRRSGASSTPTAFRGIEPGGSIVLAFQTGQTMTFHPNFDIFPVGVHGNVAFTPCDADGCILSESPEISASDPSLLAPFGFEVPDFHTGLLTNEFDPAHFQPQFFHLS
jgi:hypothetical protein